MGYLTGVVGFKAILQIFGETGIVTRFILFTHMKLHLTQSARRSQRSGFTGACGERKMFSAVSVSSNEVGVILNPTVSDFQKFLL